MSIIVTAAAIEQINLMIENDYTLEGLIPRLTITGKECDGFVYSFGFTDAHIKDTICEFSENDKTVHIHFDEFTSFYFKNGQIDFVLDPIESIDGFVIKNFDQEKFHGKFYKDESMTPTHLLGPEIVDEE